MSYLLQNFSSMMHFRCHITINSVTYFGTEHFSERKFQLSVKRNILNIRWLDELVWARAPGFEYPGTERKLTFIITCYFLESEPGTLHDHLFNPYSVVSKGCKESHLHMRKGRLMGAEWHRKAPSPTVRHWLQPCGLHRLGMWWHGQEVSSCLT